MVWFSLFTISQDSQRVQSVSEEISSKDDVADSFSRTVSHDLDGQCNWRTACTQGHRAEQLFAASVDLADTGDSDSGMTDRRKGKIHPGGDEVDSSPHLVSEYNIHLSESVFVKNYYNRKQHRSIIHD